ncbi:MAG: NADP-dependent malic enzyme [Erysipelotrichaceae bacterium]|nr:NADP-dependent malic enzyme [Erysipelotrichaceae bacterium]
MNNDELALKLHKDNKGKLEVVPKVKCETREDLSLAYTPGVAAPCLEIAKDKEKSYEYTNRGNMVAVVSDGTAVLGLGDIGPEAGLPVMEGKALLFKRFAGIDAVPLCINTKDPEEIIRFCKQIAPSFGGINLEDISAPRCVEIERRLIEELDIPVFHDDQHGTAIVVLAVMINYLRLVKRKAEDIKIVISGTGAAGSSIIRTLYNYGFKKIYAFDIDGCLNKKDMDSYNDLKKELMNYVNLDDQPYTSLKEALVGADCFVGVSAKNLLSVEMVESMSEKNIVMAMANPIPEISYEDAIKANAYIVGTGRSDYPNQINNVLAFPGLFKGALEAKATRISEKAKIAAAEGLASLVSDEELSTSYIIPGVFDDRVSDTVAEAVKKAIIEEGYIRR